MNSGESKDSRLITFDVENPQIFLSVDVQFRLQLCLFCHDNKFIDARRSEQHVTLLTWWGAKKEKDRGQRSTVSKQETEQKREEKIGFVLYCKII